MDIGITVENRRWSTLVSHGIVAGLVAGVALGIVQFIIAAARQEGALTPFQLVASLVLGMDTLEADAPTALVIVTGIVLHLVLAALFGVIFVVGLAYAYQVSARGWLLILYGVLYGFLLWEVNFLAILPVLYPELTTHIEFSSQVWKGIVAYTLVYGPVLALYIGATRPGVVADWKD